MTKQFNKCPNANVKFIPSPDNVNILIPESWVWCPCHYRPVLYLKKPVRKSAIAKDNFIDRTKVS